MPHPLFDPCIRAARMSPEGRRARERDCVSRPPDDEELTLLSALACQTRPHHVLSVVRVYMQQPFRYFARNNSAFKRLPKNSLEKKVCRSASLGSRLRMPIERPSSMYLPGRDRLCASHAGRPGELGSPLRQKVSRYCAMLLPSSVAAGRGWACAAQHLGRMGSSAFQKVVSQPCHAEHGSQGMAFCGTFSVNL